ncbi:hypothetical protein IWQ47_002891 [Aquimarina sp. EL_43]|uniref:hypothetical protein n=1 Tax=unclassified Aquimarina TaxID=2627091 RepID=UPI0018C8F734|nr:MULTISPECIES: hypothetical protein [unclassified Aquimarina]MBG6131241.1 hypothetical protein [Aquimarina sp. EL_35]MBG6151877.1 hypothetical protein [Aquimarina sp. EL_32]MBG6169807.1 hypothetical protein [Aquimarina sp. EL_43]
MFNLFSKKKLITDRDYEFLIAIAKALPSDYYYLANQVSKDFILDKKVNQLGDEGTYTLVLNSELETKYSDKSFPQLFIIKDISIWNNIKSSFEQVELHILEGMLAGFKINAKLAELNFRKIDTSKIKERHFKNEEKEFLKNLIGEVSKSVLSQLDVESTFKIEIPEGNFYVIKDLGDGNYLTMNEKGAVFGMIHDPYEVEKLFNNKEAFFNDLELGNFSIEQYYNKKMGG